MNLETKVGLFVITALMLAIGSIIRLSDVQFDRRYTLHFVFDDIKGLQNKSPVKIAGVEIGRVDEVTLDQGKAKVSANIRKDVPVYSNARVRVKATGIIGSQFLDLEPGTPDHKLLQSGDLVYGIPTRSLEELLDTVSELIEGKNGKGGIGENLQVTMSNLRNITDSINGAVGHQKREMKEIVQNLHAFTVDLRGMASDFHEISSSSKEDLQVAIDKMRSVLERVDDLLARVQRGEGAVGKLLNDKEMGEDVKKTVSNLKETSNSAKEVLARFTKIQSFWEARARYIPGAGELHGDGGIRLQPRDGKYYYLGINNAGDGKDEYTGGGDYEKENTISALLGKEFKYATLEVGAIRSRPGIGVYVSPFKNIVSEKDSYAWSRNIVLHTEAFDFTRDEIRGRVDVQRRFKGPQVNVNAGYKINRWMKLGVGVEDLTETQQYTLTTDLSFEDRDLAYLFGFVSFAR